jgi:enoyl-CoA hydratase/carnithine racemase
VFPVKYNVKKSMDYLNATTKKNLQLQQFALQLREAFDKFEEKKQIPVILVNKKGLYVFD